MKKLMNLLILYTCTILLVGCGNSVKNEEQICTDLEEYSESEFEENIESIIECKIDKRQTEKEDKVDTVWCTIKTADEQCRYEKEAILTYVFYDEGGWILEDVKMNSSSDWIIVPLKGISEANIISSLDGQSVTANGEYWNIDIEDIKEISVDKQETNLQEKRDIVTVSLTLNGDVQEVTGQLEVRYIFEGEWNIELISGKDNFVATTKTDKALNVTEKELMEELAKQEFKYGSTTISNSMFAFTDATNEQIISIDEENIIDFVIQSQESQFKGTTQIYNCSCTLTKEHATFNLNVIIAYYYDVLNGWILEPMTIEPTLKTLDIEGDWIGTYVGAPYSGETTLNITSVEEDGTMTAVYSFKPSVINRYSAPGSYNVSGKIDMLTLRFDLKAGDWVDEPENYLSITKVDVSGKLYVEESVITGRGHEGYIYTVMQ